MKPITTDQTAARPYPIVKKRPSTISLCEALATVDKCACRRLVAGNPKMPKRKRCKIIIGLLIV